MPIKIERKLKHEAKRAGLKPGSKRFNAYVFGVLHRIKEHTKRKGKVREL